MFKAFNIIRICSFFFLSQCFSLNIIILRARNAHTSTQEIVKNQERENIIHSAWDVTKRLMISIECSIPNWILPSGHMNKIRIFFLDFDYHFELLHLAFKLEAEILSICSNCWILFGIEKLIGIIDSLGHMWNALSNWIDMHPFLSITDLMCCTNAVLKMHKHLHKKKTLLYVH